MLWVAAKRTFTSPGPWPLVKLGRECVVESLGWRQSAVASAAGGRGPIGAAAVAADEIAGDAVGSAPFDRISSVRSPSKKPIIAAYKISKISTMPAITVLLPNFSPLGVNVGEADSMNAAANDSKYRAIQNVK